MRLAHIALAVVVLIARAAAAPLPIVGGQPARSADWPEVVGLLGEGGVCTGTLIAPDVVLTAGHCIGLELHTVITHADSLAAGGERIAIKWSRAYPEWDERYDVGVVMLQRMARVAPRAIGAACLANQQLASGSSIAIVGYGALTPDGDDANTQLHAATVSAFDAFCTDAPGCLASVRPNGEFAAGGRGADTCFGDSGGPAFAITRDGRALIGVVSRGLALPGPPCGGGGIYVRADKVVRWIQSVTDRQLARVGCTGAADAAALDADESASGCSVTGPRDGAGRLILLGAVLALACGQRRRRA